MNMARINKVLVEDKGLSKNRRMVVKLDLRRAFDSLEWKWIIEMVKKRIERCGG